jgi:hypothetical protein
MNQQNQHPEARHRNEALSPEALHVRTGDPRILALWESGLARWGDAFVAFTSLKVEGIKSPECLQVFESAYVTSVDSIEALIDDHLEGMGWARPLLELRDKYLIPDFMLDFNRAAVLEGFKEFMEVVEEGGRVHVFVR